MDRLTSDAAERHLAAGARAGAEIDRMRAQRLQVDPQSGRAKVGVVVTGEVIEENGRSSATSRLGSPHRCRHATTRGDAPPTLS